MRSVLSSLFALLFFIASPLLSSSQNIVFEEDFQGGSGATPPTGWSVNVVNGNASSDEWRFDNPGGRTFGESISGGKFAIFDNNQYGSNSNKEVELISPVTTVSGTQYMLAFYEYFEGGFNGKGEVYFSGNGGTSWVKVYEANSTSIANPDKVSEDLESILVNDFSPNMGNYDIQVKFVFSAPDADAFWWIIDDVMFYDKVAKDAAALKVTDLPSGCLSNLETNISASFKNLGSSNIDTLKANMILNGGDTITDMMTFDSLSGGVLAPDSIIQHTFDTTVELQDGNNQVRAWPSDPDFVADEFPANDTSRNNTTVNRLVVANLPFQDGFEDTLAFGTGWCPKPGPSGNGRVAVLPSDSISACEGNNTAVLDAPDGSSVDRLDLLVDLSSCVNKELSFTYGFRNDAVDPEDSLLISVNGGGTFHPIYDLDNNAADDTCYQVTLDLDSVAASKGLTLTNSSVLRWQHAGNGNVVDSTDGFYLDDVSIDLAGASAGDMKMLSIEKPNQAEGTDTVDVKVRFTNVGSDTVVTADMSYQYGSMAPVSEFWGGCLGSGDTTTFTFSTSLARDTSTSELCAWSSLPNDQPDTDPSNDSICLSDQVDALTDRKESDPGFSLHPNPTNDRVNVSFHKDDPQRVKVELLVIDLQGRTVRTRSLGSLRQDPVLRVDDLESGMYLVRIEKAGQKEGSYRKLMVR